MNEKLKLMAREAGLSVWLETVQLEGYEYANPKRIEQFAELVRKNTLEDIKILEADKMTRENIIKIATESGFNPNECMINLERFAARIIAIKDQQ